MGAMHPTGTHSFFLFFLQFFDAYGYSFACQEDSRSVTPVSFRSKYFNEEL